MVSSSLDLRTWIRKQLEEADSDLLRGLVADMAGALMSADADGACNELEAAS
jgi:hypothetical protein